MSKKGQQDKTWEVIIVGAGPAGSAAAMVLARMRRSVLIIDDGEPRNKLSRGMHNYLSRDDALPAEFLMIVHSELGKYGVAHVPSRAEKTVHLPNGHFEVTISGGLTYCCRRLLVATGVKDKIPEVDGMRELWGCGVYHCPYCDGYELCDKKIGLYAQKFNGFGMALSLRHLTEELTLFTDGAGYLRKPQIAQLTSKKIQIVTSRISKLTSVENRLTCVTLADGTNVPCDAVFVHHGHAVNNALLLDLGARMSHRGAAITNRKQECSIPGLYVAGDAAIDMHFVAVAAAEGTKAAVAIHDSLMKEENAALIAGLAAPAQ
jgi:thioredoxin reductase